MRAIGLKPHLTETFKLSSDPQFIDEVRDVVGLYLNPPEGALVLCVDEKSQIQALDRTAPVLPLADRAVEAPIPPLKRLLSTKWEVAVLMAVAERRAPRRQGRPLWKTLTGLNGLRTCGGGRHGPERGVARREAGRWPPAHPAAGSPSPRRLRAPTRARGPGPHRLERPGRGRC